MIQRYKIIDILNLTHLGNEDYCKSSDVKPLEKKVKQLEKDHAEELTIATLLGYDKAKDKIKKLEEHNKQLLDALIYAHKRYENVVFTKGFQLPNKKPFHPEVEDDLYYEKVPLVIENITGKKPEDYNV